VVKVNLDLGERIFVIDISSAAELLGDALLVFTVEGNSM
jgi:hypothetical protein